MQKIFNPNQIFWYWWSKYKRANSTFTFSLKNAIITFLKNIVLIFLYSAENYQFHIFLARMDDYTKYNILNITEITMQI